MRRVIPIVNTSNKVKSAIQDPPTKVDSPNFLMEMKIVIIVSTRLFSRSDILFMNLLNSVAFKQVKTQQFCICI